MFEKKMSPQEARIYGFNEALELVREASGYEIVNKQTDKPDVFDPSKKVDIAFCLDDLKSTVEEIHSDGFRHGLVRAAAELGISWDCPESLPVEVLAFQFAEKIKESFQISEKADIARKKGYLEALKSISEYFNIPEGDVESEVSALFPSNGKKPAALGECSAAVFNLIMDKVYDYGHLQLVEGIRRVRHQMSVPHIYQICNYESCPHISANAPAYIESSLTVDDLYDIVCRLIRYLRKNTIHGGAQDPTVEMVVYMLCLYFGCKQSDREAFDKQCANEPNIGCLHARGFFMVDVSLATECPTLTEGDDFPVPHSERCEKEFLPALKTYFDSNEWDPDLSTAEIVRKNTTERRKRHGESS